MAVLILSGCGRGDPYLAAQSRGGPITRGEVGAELFQAVVPDYMRDNGITALDRSRYLPADAGRFSAYSTCLYDMTDKGGGREVFDVCMTAKGYTRASK